MLQDPKFGTGLMVHGTDCVGQDAYTAAADAALADVP